MLYEEEKIIGINKTEFEKVFTPNIKRVIRAVRKYGFDVRVIGGAVRDFLIGKHPRDIDFATDADPSELIYIFQLEGIDFDAKGIGHGTIKARFGEDKIDVTSITYKLAKVKGKMISKRGMDWEQDAMGRDLTINSLSLDLNGKIHDYVNGLEDLSNQVVRFNNGISNNLDKDPHLIMRWFKALGLFDNPVWPANDWKLIRSNMHILSSIRKEEKTEKELASILRGKNARTVLGIMCANGADIYLDLTCYR